MLGCHGAGPRMLDVKLDSPLTWSLQEGRSAEETRSAVMCVEALGKPASLVGCENSLLRNVTRQSSDSTPSLGSTLSKTETRQFVFKAPASSGPFSRTLGAHHLVSLLLSYCF